MEGMKASVLPLAKRYILEGENCSRGVHRLNKQVLSGVDTTLMPVSGFHYKAEVKVKEVFRDLFSLPLKATYTLSNIQRSSSVALITCMGLFLHKGLDLMDE